MSNLLSPVNMESPKVFEKRNGGLVPNHRQKPLGLKVNFSQIPYQLSQIQRWVLWDYRPQEQGFTKVPLDPNSLMLTDITQSSTGVGFKEIDQCYQKYSGQGRVSGIGIVLREEDRLIGIDCDKCVLKRNGEEPELNESGRIFFEFWRSKGAYVEYSPSGKGLRAFIFGKIPKDLKRKADVQGCSWEIYDSQRFMTVTGAAIYQPRVLPEAPEAVFEEYRQYMGTRGESIGSAQMDWELLDSLSESDLQRLENLVCISRELDALLKGDWLDFGSQSEADMSLCNRLARAFEDPAKVQFIWENYGPWREKTEQRPDYVRTTILKAFSGLQSLQQPFGELPDNLPTEQGEPTYLLTKIDKRNGSELLTGIDHPKAAEAFALEVAGNLLSSGHFFYRYNTELGTWKLISEKQMLSDLQEFFKESTKEFPPNNVITNHRLQDILNLLSGLKSIYRAELELKFNSNPNLLVLENGVLDLDRMELVSFSRDHLATLRSPVAYDPAARCPKWDQFLQSVVPDPQDRKRLAQWVGYLLHSDAQLEKVLLLLGAGRNGKSTFIETVCSLFDPDEISRMDPCRFDQDTNLSVLMNKRLNVVTDISTTRKTSEIFKQVVSGEPVTGKKLYQDPFVFKPRVKMLLSSNHMPQSHDRSEGFLRRWDVLEFSRKIPDEEVNLRLKEQLQQELSGILNWALDGLVALRSNDWRMSDAPGFQVGNSELRDSIDHIKLFVEENYQSCTPFNPSDPKCPFVLWSVLQENYTRFCKTQNFGALNATNLAKELKRLGYLKGQKRIGEYAGSGRKPLYIVSGLRELEDNPQNSFHPTDF